MLGWMSGKPDHPMADIKQVRKFLAELPQADAQKSLEEITLSLESLGGIDQFHLGDRLEIIMLLDEAGQVHRRKLGRDYLMNSRLQKTQENRLWTAMHQFWKQLADAYFNCVRDFEADVKGAGSIKAALPLVVSRGLRAASTELKWLQLRYGPVEQSLWGRLAKLYEFAETRGIEKKVVSLYPGVPEDATAEREFLKTMMLWVSCPDSLVPLHIEMAERLTGHFSAAFVIGKERGSFSHCVDLAKQKPPMRLNQGVIAHPSVRFFDAGGAYQQLQQLIAQVKAVGLPTDINLGGTFSTGTVLEVLDHLALHWGPVPPARKYPRHKMVARLSVVNGFETLLGRIEGTALDFENEESWVVEDISAGGFAAMIPPIKSDWIRVGTLLGIKPEGTQGWTVGVVRRMNRDDKKQGHVGVQTLTKNARPVNVRALDEQFGSGNAESAMLLPDLVAAPAAAGAPARVLFKANSYAPGRRFEMNIGDGKKRLLLPLALIEQGPDYDFGQFREMVAEAASED